MEEKLRAREPSMPGGGRGGTPAVGQVAAQHPQHAVRAEQPFGAVLQADDTDYRCRERLVVGGGCVQPWQVGVDQAHLG